MGSNSVDILYHSVLQCLSGLHLKMSKDSVFTMLSVSEFQSYIILSLNAYFHNSVSNGVNPGHVKGASQLNYIIIIMVNISKARCLT